MGLGDDVVLLVSNPTALRAKTCSTSATPFTCVILSGAPRKHIPQEDVGRVVEGSRRCVVVRYCLREFSRERLVAVWSTHAPSGSLDSAQLTVFRDKTAPRSARDDSGIGRLHSKDDRRH